MNCYLRRKKHLLTRFKINILEAILFIGKNYQGTTSIINPPKITFQLMLSFKMINKKTS